MDAITQNVNNNQDLNNKDHMRNNVAPNIVFVDEQDIANVSIVTNSDVRQAIVDNEDHESEVESYESVEVQPRASKRPRRTVTQKTQQRGSQHAHNLFAGANELLIMKFLLTKLGLALLVSGEVIAHL